MATQPFDVYNAIPSRLLASETAQYSCKFVNRWSSSRHPLLYPSDAHWSSPVLVSHNNDYQMWGAGLFASNGVERVAEVRPARNFILLGA